MLEDPGLSEFLSLLEPYFGKAAQIPVRVLLRLNETRIDLDVLNRGVEELLATAMPGGGVHDPAGLCGLLELQFIVRALRKVRELLALNINATGGAA